MVCAFIVIHHWKWYIRQWNVDFTDYSIYFGQDKPEGFLSLPNVQLADEDSSSEIKWNDVVMMMFDLCFNYVNTTCVLVLSVLAIWQYVVNKLKQNETCIVVFF